MQTTRLAASPLLRVEEWFPSGRYKEIDPILTTLLAIDPGDC